MRNKTSEPVRTCCEELTRVAPTQFRLSPRSMVRPLRIQFAGFIQPATVTAATLLFIDPDEVAERRHDVRRSYPPGPRQHRHDDFSDCGATRVVDLAGESAD